MEYIVALGNPGEQYARTRHNVAWRVADAIVGLARLSEPNDSSRYHGLVSGGAWEGVPVALLYPGTFMNNSGHAAAAFVPSDKRVRMIVLYDDVALPLGRLRISVGGSAGGHNGVASIIERCGTKEFIRVRLGIGGAPAGTPLERYVLSRFTPEEEPVVASLVEKAVGAVAVILTDGVDLAMNRCNGEVKSKTQKAETAGA